MLNGSAYTPPPLHNSILPINFCTCVSLYVYSTVHAILRKASFLLLLYCGQYRLIGIKQQIRLFCLLPVKEEKGGQLNKTCWSPYPYVKKKSVYFGSGSGLYLCIPWPKWVWLMMRSDQLACLCCIWCRESLSTSWAPPQAWGKIYHHLCHTTSLPQFSTCLGLLPKESGGRLVQIFACLCNWSCTTALHVAGEKRLPAASLPLSSLPLLCLLKNMPLLQLWPMTTSPPNWVNWWVGVVRWPGHFQDSGSSFPRNLWLHHHQLTLVNLSFTPLPPCVFVPRLPPNLPTPIKKCLVFSLPHLPSALCFAW